MRLRSRREPAAAPASITVHVDGPLVVRGDVALVGSDGRPINPGRDTFALCRCGRSAIRPFCDGTHNDRFRCAGLDSRPSRQSPLELKE
jgi:CDGSH-type Zn-finger protein